MVCPHCKIKISDDSTHCNYCGYHIPSSPFTNFLIRTFAKIVFKANKLIESYRFGLFDLYYQSLAKSSVQRSKYMKEDPEQKSLFNNAKVHKTQKDRIDSFLEAALRRGNVDYIEGWQVQKIGLKKYIVSFRYVTPHGNFKYWYWMVDFAASIIKEIPRKASDMEEFRIQPDENTAFIDIRELRAQKGQKNTPQLVP